MSLISALFLLLLSLVFPANTDAGMQFVPDNFKYSTAIQGPLRGNTLYRVHLSSGILQRCVSACNDMRLFGPDNHEIPYVIIENRLSEAKIESYPAEITAYDETREEAVITMKLPEKFEPVSLLFLDIEEHDFKKHIIIEGSHDARTWEMIGEDAVYDFHSQVDLRKTEIRFPKSSYRYYRLRLIDGKGMAADRENIRLKYNGLDFSVNNVRGKKIRISRIIAKTSFEKETAPVYDELILTAFSQQTDKQGNTVIILETSIPFDRIIFELSNPYYFRKVGVYYSDTGKNSSYRLLTQGYLYRFPLSGLTETRAHIEYSATGQRFYRFVIENHNNPPLEIRQIRLAWVQKNLFFVALKDAPAYSLCFGSPAAEKPVYDLPNFINQGNWFKHASEKSATAQLLENPAYQPGIPKDIRSSIEKNILRGIVILLVIGLGYWLYALLNKTRSLK
ncbi:MAG: DUF3999 family protein [Nitrospirae bacterium]|nr:DUF3999 family protein [Nitrospirota bacterium]